MTTPDRGILERHLADVRYPCGRAELLRRAAAAGGGDTVLGLLGNLPDDDYADLDAVWTAIAHDHKHPRSV
jgi:hypothetical protein